MGRHAGAWHRGRVTSTAAVPLAGTVRRLTLSRNGAGVVDRSRVTAVAAVLW